MAMAVMGPLTILVPVVGLILSHTMLIYQGPSHPDLQPLSSPETLHFNLCPCVHHMKSMGPGPLSDSTERNLHIDGGW